MNKIQSTLFDAYTPKRATFVLVTKNRASRFEEAIKRLIPFKGPDDEIIVIDGGSTDGTQEVAERYAGTIDMFVSEPDIRGTHAINKGILLSRGKYIKPIMDDDIYHKEATEQAIVTFEAHPEIDILVCGGTKRRHDGITVNYCLPRGASYGDTAESIFRYRINCGIGYIFRRASFARFGTLLPLDYHYNDRVVLLSAIRKGGIVKFLRVNSFYHTPTPHYLTKEEYRDSWREQRRIVRQYCSLWFYIKYRLREYIIFGTMISWMSKFFSPKKNSQKIDSVDDQTIWDGTLS